MPFFGPHQAGIATPSQAFLQFAAFDFLRTSVDELRGLLQRWTRAAEALTSGRPVGRLATGDAPPRDTGESAGLSARRLTLTFGLGPALFERGGRDRLGLRSRRPAQLVELPAFKGDALEQSRCGGDLAVQVCGDHPQVVFHALHNLVRLAEPAAAPRWSVTGFGPTATTRVRDTPRNLMGFKDGTNNIDVRDAASMRRFVWAQGPDGPAWMAGGSYMVVRRIEMLLGEWDATSLDAQERTFGRHKLSGAPLGGDHEHDAVDLRAVAGGEPVVPLDAHIRLAGPDSNVGERILRRGYSFDEGIEASTGAPAGGLLFVCFQRDPRRQFIPIQRRLSASDALNRHIQHVGSAVFACPPGAARGEFVGERLFS